MHGNRMGGANIGCSSLYSICIPDIFAQHVLREMEYCGLVRSFSFPGKLCVFIRERHVKSWWRILPTNNVKRLEREESQIVCHRRDETWQYRTASFCGRYLTNWNSRYFSWIKEYESPLKIRNLFFCDIYQQSKCFWKIMLSSSC